MAKRRKMLECPYCFIEFDNYEEYDLHMALSHDEDRYVLDGDDDYY